MFKRKGPSEVEVARENELKIGITQDLSKTLKTVQKENVDTDDHAVYSTETANNVCSCLEAIFLHGLKSKAITKLASYVGHQPTAQTNLNFWTFVAKFTHGEVIAQLKHLGQITTEIGLCRAWVRVALNDGIMESYVDAMIADKKTLEYFYHRTAYLRDSEQPGIMKTYLQGLMNFELKLSYNASVLNEWSYAPLVLAGVIGSREAPPPVIKPPASKPPQASKSKEKQKSELKPTADTTVEVTRVRSRSKNSSDLHTRKPTNQLESAESDNPMEQPQFGQPSNSSYFISSSQFTSRDVEEIKKMSGKGSSVAKSECSTSSHVSCPDPPHMNVSPATYVQKLFGGKAEIGSEQSSNYKTQDIETVADGSTAAISKSGGKTVNVNEQTGEKQKGDSKTGAIDYDTPIFDQEVEIEVKIGDKHNPESAEGDKVSELEESWEEFYKSPVRKVQDLDTGRKFQRLESINRDMREEAILNRYIDSEADADNTGAGIGDKGADNHTETTKDVHATGEGARKGLMGEDSDEYTGRGSGALDLTKKSDTIAEPKVGKTVGNLQTGDSGKVTVTHANECDKGDNVEEISGGTSELLNMSQKLLNELGIEEPRDVEPREAVLIEEKVVIDADEDDDTQVLTTSSPKKKRKAKAKGGVDKLKPVLSLNAQGSAPELSDAVADPGKVNQIRTLDNPDYLRKHRFSLPAAEANKKKKGADHRQSVANNMKIPAEIENKADKGQTSDAKGEGMNKGQSSRSNVSIEDYLYKMIPDEVLLDERSDSHYSGGNEVEEHVKGKGVSGRTSPASEIDQDEDSETLGKVGESHRQSIGNNLMYSGRGWSSSFEGEQDDILDDLSSTRPGSLPVPSRPKAESFGTLLQNYTPGSSMGARSIDDVLASLPESGYSRDTIVTAADSSRNEDYDMAEGYEVVHDSINNHSNEALQMALFSEIANEKGLDAQNFQCKGCARAIGLIFGKPRVCRFDGGYYCYECHENDEYYMPALIVHNWDFRKHKVSKKNLSFLQDCEERPCINIDEANPRLYQHVPEMLEIQTLRMQLLFLKSYLFTCKQSIAEDFRRLVWPRDYLCEGTELYSLSDLLQVPTGGLASSLRKVIKFASKHIYGCRLCSQKGFICELCNNPKVIYAFEMDATYRCPQCKSVYHKECKTDNRPCPKCHRRRLRHSLTGTSSEHIITPDYDQQHITSQ